MRKLPGILLLCCLFLGCQPREPEIKQKLPPTKLNIFALQELRDSGFESAVIKEFGARNNTAINLSLFPDLPTLLQTLNQDDKQGQVDLVLGIDNAFAMSDSLLEPFAPLPEISLIEISHEIPRHPEHLLIPYAYANLTFLYDSDFFPQPPQSFGELQDARYYAQLALCDAATDGLGRSTLLWSVSIFGENGYDKLWSSLRKNVRKVYANRNEALDALRSGECKLMLGLHSAPAWIVEFHPSESHIKSAIPQEGSFQYLESAAICKEAPNRSTAIDFLRHLISAETQQFVMFKLGLLPVNGRTPLPRQFSRIPLSVFTMNDRLDGDLADENMPIWLERWSYLINRRPGF